MMFCVIIKPPWTTTDGDGYRSSSLLAAVTELVRGDGSVAVRWRQSYSFSTSDVEPRIFASAQHVE